jgi:hypothetical protein
LVADVTVTWVQGDQIVAAGRRAREVVRDVLPALLLTRLVFVVLTLLIPLWRTATGLGPSTSGTAGIRAGTTT